MGDNIRIICASSHHTQGFPVAKGYDYLQTLLERLQGNSMEKKFQNFEKIKMSATYFALGGH